ncbi:MAG: T9SS type A sorting domain-containing protein, partial [Bacteroidota bacterium]|nr:T9SS type A sorting domain-containing protein [Bacteroidota bacterium]
GGAAANFRNVMKLAADSSGNIYAATKDYIFEYGPQTYSTSGGLFKSTNGGTSWSGINDPNFPTNYFNPCDVIPITSSTILFAVNANSSTLGGIYRTTNGGTTWGLVTTGLPTTNYGRIAMTQDPTTANTVYAAFESNDLSTGGDAGLKGIFKSTDAGASWTQLTSPPHIASTGNLSYLSGGGWYDNVISVNPNNSSIIYVGGVDMMKSTDGGISWKQATYWDIFYGDTVVHADHHAIVFDKNAANTLYAGNDGGIYKSTNNGTSWTSMNNGLEITQFYSGAVYKNGSTYHGGTQDNGHLKYGGTGTSWTTVKGGDGGYSAQDQTNSSIMYEEYVYLAMRKSTDGGSTWNNCVSGLTDANNSSLCLFIAPFAMNRENSNVLIAGSDKVWVTSNSTGTWTKSSNTLSTNNNVSAVTILNSTVNYLGFAGTTDGKVFKCDSLDPAPGTDNWRDITPAGNNTGWVRRIVVDSTNKKNIYATYGGYDTSGTLQSRHVWHSTNQGTSWTDISGNLPNVPVHTLVIDPNSSSTLYVGTETGVYTTTDNGITWTTLNSGMPSYVPVDELVMQNDTRSLFAFTHGRGVWKLDNVLPVELTEFFALSKTSSVELQWTTATENNNYGFEVEKSYSPNQWEKIGFIDGAGTSNSQHHYTFTDQSPSGGINTYRLKQIDHDGKFKYSPIAEATVPMKFSLSQNFPNPFNPATAIKFSVPSASHVSLKIFNSAGQEVADVVSQDIAAGTYTARWDATGFASGVYFYRLQTGNLVETKKLMLLK